MNHGSLFSGIGGFDLAAEWMGWENIFHCENNEFGQKILKHYWPRAQSYGDIKKTDFSIHRGTIDILTGGFPCQPYSNAGKRKGKEDDRHLWPEMLRAIREIQPSWIVGENVRGLTNWVGGLVFDEVQSEMEAEGYEVLPFLLPACAVNAPHRRDRIWFIAHSKSNGDNRSRQCRDSEWKGSKEIIGTGFRDKFNEHGEIPTAAYAERSSIEREYKQRQRQGEFGGCNSEITTNSNSRRQSSKEHRKKESRWFTKKGISGNWENFPTQSPICNGDDGLSSRLDGITFPKWRNESIKGGGNAIVPQVVYEIFKAIEKYNQLITK